MQKIIAICLALWAQSALAEGLSGEDKEIHFIGSATVAVVITAATENPWAGFWSAVAIGVAKEIIDHRRPDGKASGRDLVADVAGAYLGSQAGRWILSLRGETTAVLYSFRF